MDFDLTSGQFYFIEREDFKFDDQTDSSNLQKIAHFFAKNRAVYINAGTVNYDKIAAVIAQDSAVALNKERKLVVVGNGDIAKVMENMGLRFNDDIYYCLSQGLLDP